MTHLLVLVLVVIVGSADSAPDPASWMPDRLQPRLDALRPATAWVTLGGLALTIPALGVIVSRCVRAMDRTGRLVHVRIADRALRAAQWCTVLWLGVCVHALGWLELIRTFTGDLILVDELLALAPVPLVLSAQWAVFYPVERRLRESALLGRLDRAEPVHPYPKRAEFVTDQLRTAIGPTLAAASMLFAWVETVELINTSALHRFPDQPVDVINASISALLIGGAFVIITVLPLLWRVLWRTTRLPPGALRHELETLCARHRVRVADLLVWETRGTVLNGALIGVLPRLRYIMLTDALLERLGAREVEAVMAHEIAHARKRHIPWLIASVLVGVGIASAGVGLAFSAWIEGHDIVGSILGAVLALACAIVLLGWISRRFEEQADAFAARHLALVRAELQEIEDPVIESADARGMSDALGAVALHNHMPIEKFSFRHGSIGSRQRRLARLVGTPVDRLPIDRSVRTLKRAVLLGAVALAFVLWRFPAAGSLL